MTTQTTSPVFWENEPNGEFPPFMTRDMKEQLVAEQQEFQVHSLRKTTTEYGPTWMLEVEVDGERWTLPLSSTPMRDAQMNRLADHLRHHGPVACGLRTAETKNGRAWVLTPPGSAPDA